MRKFVVAAAAMLAIAFSPGLASAGTYGAGDTDTITFFQAANPPDQLNDLEAELEFTIVSLDATTLVIEFTLTNTTVGVGTITSVGFATDPDATAAEIVSGDEGTVFRFAEADAGIPSLSLIEVCSQYDSIQNQCSGGGINDGLAPGDSDTFTITLTGTWGSTVDLTDFGVKFQGAPESFEFYGDGTPDGTTDGQTPDGTTDGQTPDGDGAEPATLLLLGSGFALAANRFRRRRAS